MEPKIIVPIQIRVTQMDTDRSFKIVLIVKFKGSLQFEYMKSNEFLDIRNSTHGLCPWSWHTDSKYRAHKCGDIKITSWNETQKQWTSEYDKLIDFDVSDDGLGESISPKQMSEEEFIQRISSQLLNPYWSWEWPLDSSTDEKEPTKRLRDESSIEEKKVTSPQKKKKDLSFKMENQPFLCRHSRIEVCKECRQKELEEKIEELKDLEEEYSEEEKEVLRPPKEKKRDTRWNQTHQPGTLYGHIDSCDGNCRPGCRVEDPNYNRYLDILGVVEDWLRAKRTKIQGKIAHAKRDMLIIKDENNSDKEEE
jgi:hypothetical protein